MHKGSINESTTPKNCNETEMQNNYNKQKKQNECEKNLRITEVITGIISGITALVAVIISLVSIQQSNNLLDYQISQERLPKITVLNDSITNSFEITYDDKIYSYESINNLNLPIYNIGVGVAKNCKISWDTTSIKNACLSAKDVLSKYVSCDEFEYSKDTFPSLTVNDYLFKYKNNEFDSILLYDKATNETKEIDFSYSDLRLSYILPVSNQSSNFRINIPAPITIFLLEYAKNRIEENIDVYINCTYEDIAGKTYTNKIYVVFKVDNVIIKENETISDNDTIICTYNIETKEIQS